MSVLKILAKKKKHTLTFDQEFDFDMIGVCSHHSDYRLVWNINAKIGLQLAKSHEDYSIMNKKGEVVSNYSMYEYRDEYKYRYSDRYKVYPMSLQQTLNPKS